MESPSKRFVYIQPAVTINILTLFNKMTVMLPCPNLSFGVSYSFLMHVNRLQNYKARSPRHKELLSPAENSVPELPETRLVKCLNSSVLEHFVTVTGAQRLACIDHKAVMVMACWLQRFGPMRIWILLNKVFVWEVVIVPIYVVETQLNSRQPIRAEWAFR